VGRFCKAGLVTKDVAVVGQDPDFSARPRVCLRLVSHYPGGLPVTEKRPEETDQDRAAWNACAVLDEVLAKLTPALLPFLSHPCEVDGFALAGLDQRLEEVAHRAARFGHALHVAYPPDGVPVEPLDPDLGGDLAADFVGAGTPTGNRLTVSLHGPPFNYGGNNDPDGAAS
jgi:hypothetical protein